MHSGLLSVNQQKMSKSLGNAITIQEFLKSWPAEVLRLSFLSNQYSSPIDFSTALFESNRKRVLYYYETLAALSEACAELPQREEKTPASLVKFEQEFHQALSDDFNTPGGFAVINQLMRLANQELAKKRSLQQAELLSGILTLLTSWGKVLGLFTAEPSGMIVEIKRQILVQLGIAEEEIAEQIRAREHARAQKEWQRADEIRGQLEQRGILLKDGARGTEWTIVQNLQKS
jgi:cysteinyl-tRNA synthetase